MEKQKVKTPYISNLLHQNILHLKRLLIVATIKIENVVKLKILISLFLFIIENKVMELDINKERKAWS